MDVAELDALLAERGQYSEIWLSADSGEQLCALLNGEIGWLLYLRFAGDPGYSSRNPAVSSGELMTFCLSNGECDEFPRAWTYPMDTLRVAMASFLTDGSYRLR